LGFGVDFSQGLLRVPLAASQEKGIARLAVSEVQRNGLAVAAGPQ